MSDPQLLLASYLKTLRLPTFLREYATVARQCGEKDASYDGFLQQLAELEVQHRQVQSIARRIKQAAFPVAKDLADFDFVAVPKLNKKRVLDLAQGSFIEQRANVVLNGAPGVGKTHLAIGLGREEATDSLREGLAETFTVNRILSRSHTIRCPPGHGRWTADDTESLRTSHARLPKGIANRFFRTTRV